MTKHISRRFENMAEQIDSKEIVNVEKGDRDIYQKIAQTKYFKGDKSDLNMALIFCLAVAMGYKNNKFSPITKKDWVTRRSYITKNKYMLSFVTSVALVYSKSIKLLSNFNEVFNIAESFANGGIKILSMKIFDNYTDFDKEVESELYLIEQKLKR